MIGDIVDRVNAAVAQKQLVIPDGHKIAVIIDANQDNQGLKTHAIVGMKLGDGWHFGLVSDWSHETGVTTGLKLEWSK